MSRAVGRESLDIPKFGRESRERLSRPISRLSRPNFFMSRLSQLMSRISRPNFGITRLSRPTARLTSRLSRLKFSAQLCNLCLNLGAPRSSKSGHDPGTSILVARA